MVIIIIKKITYVRMRTANLFYKCELLTSTLKDKQIKVSSIRIFWYWLFLKISIIK